MLQSWGSFGGAARWGCSDAYVVLDYAFYVHGHPIFDIASKGILLSTISCLAPLANLLALSRSDPGIALEILPECLLLPVPADRSYAGESTKSK